MRAALAVGILAATAFMVLATGPRSTEDPGRAQADSYAYDFENYYRPNAEYMASRFRAGKLPLWNPHHAAGIPFLATYQPGVLYPPNLLHAVVPVQTAFAILAAFHIALAAFFTAAWARSLGASQLGAGCAGLLFAVSIQTFVYAWYPSVLYAAAWMPALLLACDRAATQPTAAGIAGIGGALAMQLLAGWPYLVALTALACALYVGTVLVGQAVRLRRVPLRALGVGAAGIATGLFLAAPQLLPTLELLERSCRAIGSLAPEQVGLSLPGHDPHLFFLKLLREGANDAIPGIAALPLIAWGLLRPDAGTLRRFALFAVALVTLAASFPNHFPVYDLLRDVPILGDFRFPFRYRLVTHLIASVLTGLGLSSLQAALSGHPRIANLTALMAASAVILPSSLLATHAPRFPRGAPPLSAPLQQLQALTAQIRPEPGRIYWSDRPTSPPGKIGAAGELEVVHDMEPFTLASTARMLTYFEVGRPLTVHPPASGGEEGRLVPSAPFAGILRMPGTGERARILDLLSSNLIISREPHAWLARRYRRLSRGGERPLVFANPGALPRAYRVTAAEREPTEIALALQRLTSPDFSPSQRVLLDPLIQSSPTRRDSDEPSGEVSIAHYEPEFVQLHTRGVEPGFVVLTDTHYPGWYATLDGEPVPILRANTLFRAVSVPAGDHRIEMRFQPRSLRIGAALAVAGAIICLGVVLRRDPGRRVSSASAVPSGSELV